MLSTFGAAADSAGLGGRDGETKLLDQTLELPRALRGEAGFVSLRVQARRRVGDDARNTRPGRVSTVGMARSTPGDEDLLGSASTWIRSVVHRRAVDVVRRQTSFNALPDRLQGMAPRAEPTEDDMTLRETRREAQAALSALSKAEREVLELAYWGGLTQSEIAAALGIPSGTVKSRTFTALARLREALGKGLTAAY
jgi:RNA polymerase sigma-70 factor, ECF subfamily